MPAPDTRVATVRTAERGGGQRPSEDRVFTTHNAVILLDGASEPEPRDANGGWFAEVLGHELRDRLSTGHDDLTRVLAGAIDDVTARYGLTPGEGPSTTVSIVRWDGAVVEALVLGDSPVVAETRTGDMDVLRDKRLRQVAPEIRGSAPTPGLAFDDRAWWRALVAAERAARNREGGYWIAEATPAAAAHAYQRRWAATDIAAVLLVTDGVAAGVDTYGVPHGWREAIDIAMRSPEDLIQTVCRAEASDPDGKRWPRSKAEDDKAAALITFG